MSAADIPAIEAAIASLASHWQEDGRHMVSVPVQYPSGALSVVEVVFGREHVWVSDLGLGYSEAEMMSAESAYPRAAKAEADRRGVSFDGRSVFALELPLSALSGGIAAIANASVRAASEAIRSEAARRHEEKSELIFDRVRLAFPDAHVAKVAEITGERAAWEAHNVVSLRDGKIAIFEPVSAYAASISAKFLMFSDLKSRPEIRLNAVFDAVDSLDSKARMIFDVANVILTADGLENYRRAVSPPQLLTH